VAGVLGPLRLGLGRPLDAQEPTQAEHEGQGALSRHALLASGGQAGMLGRELTLLAQA